MRRVEFGPRLVLPNVPKNGPPQHWRSSPTRPACGLQIYQGAGGGGSEVAIIYTTSHRTRMEPRCSNRSSASLISSFLRLNLSHSAATNAMCSCTLTCNAAFSLSTSIASSSAGGTALSIATDNAIAAVASISMFGQSSRTHPSARSSRTRSMWRVTYMRVGVLGAFLGFTLSKAKRSVSPAFRVERPVKAA